MDYEKKYKKALERAKKLIETCDSTAIVDIFPELKESEDEKIKHEIEVILANTDLSCFALDYTFADMISWLEKQGEQKPAWSEEDERILDALITSLNHEVFVGRLETLKGIEVSSVINWLKSIKHS